jgi:hypothetical protein
MQNNGYPKDAYVLIFGTCEYITLHRKRDVADVIKDLEIRRLSWINQVGLM